MNPTVVCALYKFVPITSPQSMQAALLDLLRTESVRGTVLLAPEGINGTIAGPAEGIRATVRWLERKAGLGTIETKESLADEPPFRRTKVKLKKEIVTLGVDGIDPNESAGTYIEPEDWNRLIGDPEVLLIDTRNDYEYEIGTFEGAINPQTKSFREFPAFANSHLDPKTHRKVAMFCTGGIRCEKSTALLRTMGFDTVYHLRGGILNYLSRIPESESKWRGECFVFDERVTVDHNLQSGGYDQCHACRRPVSEVDKQSPNYSEGVCCPRCHGRTSPADRARFVERQRQVAIATSRGRTHIGTEAMPPDHPSRVQQNTDESTDQAGGPETLSHI